MRKSSPKTSGSRPQPSPRERAIRLLSRREHGARELAFKLEQRGVAADAAARAVATLREEGWQSDLRYAGALIRTRAGQGYGPRRVRHELEGAGVDAAIIDEALDQEAIDWEAVARQWFAARGGRTDSPAGRAREWRRLAARGFASDTVRRLLGEGDD